MEAMTVTLSIFIIITILLIWRVTLDMREKYTTHLDHKTKCFDCESDMIARCGAGCAWRAQPAKSFDAEFDLLQRNGDIEAGFGAKTLKYY